MAALFLSLHVIAGIIFVGPVTVAVSLFPRYVRLAAEPASRVTALPVVRLLRRISVVYAVLGVSVPVLGLVTAAALGAVGDAWVLISLGLVVIAGLLLALRILPAQATMLQVLSDPSPAAPTGSGRTGVDGSSQTRSYKTGTALALDTWSARSKRLAMSSGIFALLWVVVVVLMILRPGSTTGI